MNRKQEFIKHYLQNHSIRQTCKEMHISEMTAYRMLKSGLREQIENLNNELYQISLQDLQAESEKVNAELINIITNKDVPYAVKLNAIKSFYEIISLSKISQIENDLKNYNIN